MLIIYCIRPPRQHCRYYSRRKRNFFCRVTYIRGGLPLIFSVFIYNAALLVRGFLNLKLEIFADFFNISNLAGSHLSTDGRGGGGEEARSSLFWRGNELKKMSGRAVRTNTLHCYTEESQNMYTFDVMSAEFTPSHRIVKVLLLLLT
jgi:hypothetical protein